MPTDFKKKAIERAAMAAHMVQDRHAGRLDQLVDEATAAFSEQNWSQARLLCEQIAGEAPWLNAPLAGALAFEIGKVLESEDAKSVQASNAAFSGVRLAAEKRLGMNDSDGAELRDQLIELRTWREGDA